MSSEMFATDRYGGDGEPKPHWWNYGAHHPEINRVNVKQEDVMVAAVKLAHSVKWILRLLLIFLVVYMVIQLITVWAPDAAIAYKTIKHWAYPKSSFTQKENLQWLGASTDVIRGDYENNTDSLAEKAMKNDASTTDMSATIAAAAAGNPSAVAAVNAAAAAGNPAAVAAKSTFMSRQRMTQRALTPEEQRMKEQASH